MYFDIDFGREMVLEATLEGVRIIPFEVFKKQNIIIKIYIPRKNLKQGLAKAGELLGERYDFIGLFGMLWVLFGHWLRKKWRNPWDNPHALFCSEFVAQTLQWSGYPNTEYWDPSAMSPQDLYEFVLRDEARSATL